MSTPPTNRRGSRSKPLWYWTLLTLPLVVIAATVVPTFTQRAYQPGLGNFFPKPISGEGITSQFSRLALTCITVAALVSAILLGVVAKATLVPGHGQMVVESFAGFIRDNVAIEMFGPKKRCTYAGFIGFAFFATLVMNPAGVVPGTSIAVASVVAAPVIFTIISYVTYVSSGIKAPRLEHFFASQLLPPGFPKPMYLLITPIEFFSNFIVHLVTLTVRLLTNMMAGHLLLNMTYFRIAFLLQELSAFLAAGTLTGAAMFAMTGFEVLVAFLQTYILAILTSVCIKFLIESHRSP